MHSNKSSTRQLCLAGLLTAVVMVLTMIRLPVPMTEGYAHIGDAAILLCGLVLGPLGSALIDLYGFAIYAPFTLVIKGAMGFFAGKFLKSGLKVKNIAIVIAISAFMVLAYFLTDMVLYGWATALGSALGNVTQALASIALGCVVLALPVDRIRG